MCASTCHCGQAELHEVKWYQLHSGGSQHALSVTFLWNDQQSSKEVSNVYHGPLV